MWLSEDPSLRGESAFASSLPFPDLSLLVHIYCLSPFHVHVRLDACNVPRLTKQHTSQAISKRLAVRCPGPESCPHIHPFDMDQSCRFVVKRRDDGTINCNQVFKNHMCSRGHNLVTARQTAYEQFDVHKAEARSLGSFGNVKFKRF